MVCVADDRIEIFRSPDRGNPSELYQGVSGERFPTVHDGVEWVRREWREQRVHMIDHNDSGVQLIPNTVEVSEGRYHDVTFDRGQHFLAAC